jgi:MFS family permease
LREQARPAIVRESRRAPWLAVSVVCFGAFMGQLDASIVTITFPAMEHDFGAPVAAVQWVSLAVVALAGAVAFIRREIRVLHPLIPVWLLRSRPLALGLAAAGCGYLALFGPLVLIPQVLLRDPGSVARTGLLLSALPLGFGFAALLGDPVLPKGWGDRRRGLAGALLACAAMAAATVIPLTPATVVPQLAVAGVGLGIFVPANNTVIMRSVADSSASLIGGLVSMARGMGTTLGISLMALAWHFGSQSYQAGNTGYAGTEQARPAFGLLAAAAATAAAIVEATRAKARGQPIGSGEADPSGAFH